MTSWSNPAMSALQYLRRIAEALEALSNRKRDCSPDAKPLELRLTELERRIAELDNKVTNLRHAHMEHYRRLTQLETAVFVPSVHAPRPVSAAPAQPVTKVGQDSAAGLPLRQGSNPAKYSPPLVIQQREREPSPNEARICSLYNDSRGDFMAAFGNKLRRFKLSNVPAVLNQNAQAAFSLDENGPYLLVPAEDDIWMAFPGFDIIANKGFHPGLSKMFILRGYETGMRYRRLLVRCPAQFLIDNNRLELGDRGTLDLTDPESDV